MKRIFFPFLLAASGCATNNTIDQAAVNNLDAIKIVNPVYAKLKKTDSGYVFSEFSETYISGKPWVRLLDKKPMWNTKQEDCLGGLAKDSLQCKSEDAELFRIKSIDLGDGAKATGYVAMSALSMGLWATMPPTAVKFDRDEYERAALQATLDLEEKTNASGTSLDSLYSNYENLMMDFYNKYESLVSNYTSDVSTLIEINDRSGLFRGVASGFNRNVIISKNQIPLAEGRGSLSSPELILLLSDSKSRNLKFIEELTNLTSNLKIRCNTNGFEYLEFDIKCPAELSSRIKNLKIPVTIHSVSFDNVMPKFISVVDDNVTVELVNGLVKAKNKSSKFLTIDSLSFYHNGKIATLAELNREFSPESESEITYIKSAPISKEAISFKKLTAAIAGSKNVNYGIAIKYRIADTNKEKTLYKSEDFKLRDLI
tara:strand:- start:95 stop:1378 length:1284 start_codon:yes stop_codon:yes gene_type:complete